MFGKKEIRKIEVDRKKICRLCNEYIDEETERWVLIVDYLEKNRECGVGYYHLLCWKNRWKEREKLLYNKMKQEIVDTSTKLLQKVGLIKNE